MISTWVGANLRFTTYCFLLTVNTWIIQRSTTPTWRRRIVLVVVQRSLLSGRKVSWKRLTRFFASREEKQTTMRLLDRRSSRPWSHVSDLNVSRACWFACLTRGFLSSVCFPPFFLGVNADDIGIFNYAPCNQSLGRLFRIESLHCIKGLNKFKLGRSTSLLTADKKHRIAMFEKAESWNFCFIKVRSLIK